MREIKFRAWDKVNECWLVDIFVYNDGSVWSCEDIDGYNLLHEEFSIDIIQYTGLKDKNNNGDKELYENDIVYIAGTGNCIVSICPILGVSFRSIEDGNSVEAAHDVLMECDLGELIGSVYENPELLK